MKLNGSVAVLAAMMLGSTFAVGCKAKTQVTDDLVDPGSMPADAATAASSTDVAGVVVAAPPPPRVEVQGPAPSPHHVGVPGYGYNVHPTAPTPVRAVRPVRVAAPARPRRT